MGYVLPMNMAPAEVGRLRSARWMARTNLRYLCREVLGFKDVTPEVHGPILDIEQKFLLPPPEKIKEYDKVIPGQTVIYTPWMDPYDLPGGRRMLLLDPRGGLKCACAGTLVTTPQGYMSVEKLLPGDEVYGYNPECHSLVRTRVEEVETQSPQDAYRISFRSGRQLEVSHEHPFWTMFEWTSAKDLKLGDRIPVLASTPEPDEAETHEAAELVGWMLGDGCVGQQTITNKKPEFLARIQTAAQRAGFESEIVDNTHLRRTAWVRIRGARGYFRELGLLGATSNEYARSGEKFIPARFFCAAIKSVCELLYGLYMSDGTATKTGIHLTTKSRRLASDVQRLLTRLGIWAHVRSLKTWYKTERREYWTVSFRRAADVKRFVSAVGWNKINRFVDRTGNPNVDTVPRTWRRAYGSTLWSHGTRPTGLPVNKSFVKYDISKEKLLPTARALGDKWLEALCAPTFVWDTVTKVEYLGRRITYAVQTENGTILLDNVVTHNTTINCVAHLVQWITNFPHLAYLFVQSNTEKAEDVMRDIRQHFQYNQVFRQIFPDLVPHKHISDWGNRSEFFVPDDEENARLRHRLTGMGRKEPTVRAASIDKGSAGSHYDVMKFSDIVEPNNTKTDSQIKDVIYNFWMMENLLVRPDGWIDVEGTRYHFNDLYGEVVDKWKENEAFRKHWRIHVRSCYIRDFGDKPPDYTPLGLDAPFKMENGSYISWWPKRFSVESLEGKKATDLYIFATQQLNDPVAGDEGSRPFPLKMMQWIKPGDFVNVRVSHFVTTVDTADTVGARSNFSCITTCAWDSGGRCYVVDVRLAKMLPSDIIDNIVEVSKKYRPTVVRVEETAFVRGLKAALERRMHLLQFHVPVEYIKRENETSKQERILNTLQPWYKRGEIRFLTDLGPKEHITKELSRFPATSNDFMDTLADQWQNREWFGRLGARPNAAAAIMSPDARMALLRDRALDIALDTAEPWGEVDGWAVPLPPDAARRRTGGL